MPVRLCIPVRRIYNFVLAEENMVEHSGKSAFAERRNRSNNFDSMMMKSSLWKSQGDAILSAAIGGARYGIKIRFPHALVMTLLFQRHLTNREKINRVLKLVWIHSSNLSGFATLYKVCVNDNSYSIFSNMLTNCNTFLFFFYIVFATLDVTGYFKTFKQYNQ